jgi:hypothetical protein
MPDLTTNPVRYRLNNGVLEISEANSPFVPLTDNQVKVIDLIFTEISNPIAKSIQVKISIENQGKVQSTQFSAVLRGK